MEPDSRGGCGEGGRRRAASASGQCRGVETSWKRSRGPSREAKEEGGVSWVIGRRGQEEEEKEEEGCLPNPGQEGSGQPVWHYGARPEGRSPPEGEEEGPSSSSTDPKQEAGELIIGWQQQLELKPGELRGGRQRPVRARYINAEGVETMPRRIDHDDDCRGKGSSPEPDGHPGRTYGWRGACNSYPVCSTDIDANNERPGGTGAPSLGTPVGPVVDRPGSRRSRPGSPASQGVGGTRQGHEARVAEAVGAGSAGEAVIEQCNRDHEGGSTSQRGAEGASKGECSRWAGQRKRPVERMEAKIREGREGRKSRQRKEGQGRGEEEGYIDAGFSNAGYKEENYSGFESGLSREGLSGRASPGIWDSGARQHGAPGGALAPGGRELGKDQGSVVFDEVEGAPTARLSKSHEIDDGFFQQHPQPGTTGLLHGDTGTGVGSDPLHPSKPPGTAEVFRRALGTMMCDDKMRSNMGKATTMAQGDLLPLPVPQDDLQLAATVASLNHLGGWNNPPPGSVTSDLQQSALKNLCELVHRHRMWSIGEHDICFDDFFKRKSVDYLGDEVKVAMTVNWRAVCDSFPQEVGCLELERFCRLGTLEYVNQFEDFLLPPEDWKYVKPPRVMVEKDGWPELCQGLVARNVCDIMPIEDLCHVEGKPLLNGMFSVGKGEFKNGLETQRLIMNLIPVNALCRPLAGDIGTLPGIAGLSGFLLEAGEVVLLSSEDIRCFFYLFGVPAKWRKYLGFNKLVPPELVPQHLVGKDCVLVAKVLPMGFLNSVSIAQHVHRNVVKWAGMAGVGGEREMRKDRPLSSGSALYRVYLDNFDFLERTERGLAEKIKGGVADPVQQVRQQYESMGLPRHPKKSVQRALQGEVQGAWLDGEAGFATPKPEKVQVYCKLADELLRRGQCTLRELQVVCGGFIYICVFRRALLGCLNEVFVHMQRFEGEAPVVRLALPWSVKVELSRFVALSPLGQMDFRTSVDGVVTCSDASTQGGGACSSVGLSDYGMAALNSEVRGDVPEAHDLVQVLTVGLFDGIGALRVACDILGLPMAGHVSIEKDPKGRRVVESFFPETEFFDDVVEFGADEVAQLALKYSNVGVVLVGAGPPCQGVSGLNADRKGAIKDERSSLYVHVPRICTLFRQAFPWAQVHELIENVASMTGEDRALMSSAFGKCPFRIDSKGIALCSRPRLYWISWDLSEAEGVETSQNHEDGFQAYSTVSLKAEVEAGAFLERGWSLREGCNLPTFTTSRPRTSPGRRPAGINSCEDHELQRWSQDSYRFPPYQYKDTHGLWNKKGEWRRPGVQEREVIMGFPLDYTKNCVVKAEQKGQDYNDARLTLLGNSWQVGVVAWLILQLMHPLGLCRKWTLQTLVEQFTPGRGVSFYHVLMRPPFPCRQHTPPGQERMLW